MLLEKATYFAAFNLLDPMHEDGFKETVQQIKNVMNTQGDSFSEEIQEWALKLLLREALDDYIGFSIQKIQEIVNMQVCVES